MRAASPAACGAAAEVPVNGWARHKVGNGTVALNSGLGRGEFGPHDEYIKRRPSSSTAATANHSGPSPGNGMLPRADECSSHAPSVTT